MAVALRKAFLVPGQSLASDCFFYGCPLFFWLRRILWNSKRILWNSIGSYGIPQDPMEFHRILRAARRLGRAARRLGRAARRLGRAARRLDPFKDIREPIGSLSESFKEIPKPGLWLPAAGYPASLLAGAQVTGCQLPGRRCRPGPA